MFTPDTPVFIIAEMSANHGQDFAKAVNILHAAREAGADAVKIQTYTPDTITIDCDSDLFRIDTPPWEGRTLHELYGEAYTPWEWQPELKRIADDLGIVLFSSPFDETAVDFLETINVPCYKIASFELVDIPLIRKVARTNKPVIMSTGMSTKAEIEEAVSAFHQAGGTELALLKCVSSYPAPPEAMNLNTIPDMARRFSVATGLSDHTLGSSVAVASVALGARIVEKHFTLSRDDQGPDSSFSMEPKEFADMVQAIRTVEKALGSPSYGPGKSEKSSGKYRRSLFVTADMDQGDTFTEANVRSIRPAMGLHTRHRDEILGRKAKTAISRGTPLAWDLID